jgi:hypothetical protein
VRELAMFGFAKYYSQSWKKVKLVYWPTQKTTGLEAPVQDDGHHAGTIVFKCLT